MKRIAIFGALVCGLVLTSCTKKIYWEDMELNKYYPISRKTEIKIQPGDKLRILVSSKDPELSAPFNVGLGGYRVNTTGDVNATAITAEYGYLVDNEGNIELPTLGKMRVEGLTLSELSNQITERLRRGMMKDALVSVTLMNLKIRVIGEVGGATILSVDDDKLTLLDAIILAGGLSNNASMGEVMVIREEANGRRMMINDMRTVSVFNAPTFYLQQNDIVYVLPKVAQQSAMEARAWQLATMLLGVAGTGVSFIILSKIYGQ